MRPLISDPVLPILGKVESNCFPHNVESTFLSPVDRKQRSGEGVWGVFHRFHRAFYDCCLFFFLVL